MYLYFPKLKPKDECGVYGVFNHENAAQLTALGLHALQHRGQDSAGIVTSDKTKFLHIEEWVRFQMFFLIKKF